jgi:hypothetical protein
MTTEERLSTKELALRAVQSLPDDAELGEILEEIVVFKTLQERLDRIDSTPTYTHEEVKRRMAAWRR